MPAVAALGVVVSAALGIVTNVATESARVTVVVATVLLVIVAASLAWLDGRARLATDVSHAGQESENPTALSGRPPRVWSAPSRNPAFVGREAVLGALRQRLAAGITVMVPETLYGLGGVGKTQTAIEYAYRFANEYDVVWWIPAEHPSQVRLSLTSLAARLDIPTGEGTADAVSAVLDALRQNQPYARWLLIYDNAEDPAELRGLLPHGAGHVLITSRNRAWSEWARAIELSVFDREESLALLHLRMPSLPEPDARAVAEKLGDLPLAIEQAGAWLATTAMPVHDYLDLLDVQPMRTVDDSPPASYGRAVSATWLLSLERLRTTEPAAAALLELCACFAPEPVPLNHLFHSEHCLSELAAAEPAIRDPVVQAKAIREIGQSALARIDPARSTVHIHRLVRAAIRAILGTERLRHHQRLVWRILAEVNPGDVKDLSNWKTYAQLWQHVDTANIISWPSDDERHLVTDIVEYLWLRGDYPGCQNLVEAALRCWQPTLGPDNRTVLRLGIHLGNAMRGQTRYTEAYDNDSNVHIRARQVYGEDDRLTLRAASSVACDLRTRGEFRQGYKIDSDTAGRCRRVLDDDDPLALNIINNLAVSLRWIGDFRAAAALDKTTLDRYHAWLGEHHPRSFIAANNYGIDLRWIGDLKNSTVLLETTLAASRQILGPSHPNALLVATNLAVTLRRLGDYTAAHAITAEALPRCERHLGTEHRFTLACSVNLACEQSALGDHAAALATATATLAQYQAVFDNDHPLSLVCANNLALFRYRLNDLAAAFDTADHVVTQFRESLGDNHPYTLAGMINLANAAYAMGRLTQAHDTDEEIYARSVTVLGEDHYQTRIAATNLAVSRRRSRRRLGCDLEPQPT
ncbi:FxSxx-COOH system tetratricopeptide repeat protein [Actinomycetes bacterium KLBMP 9797]